MVAGSLVTVALLALGLFQLVGLLARSTESVDRRVDARDLSELEVRVTSGTVEVVGVDSDTLTLSGSVTSGLIRTEHAESVENGRYLVTADCPKGPAAAHCDVDYRIEVPRGLAVRVRTNDSGVNVRDVDGAVDVRTSNAPIRAEGLTGDTTLRTSNDLIEATDMAGAHTALETSNDRVRLEFAVPPTAVSVATSNDEVSVVLPDTEDWFAVDIRTSNGEQRTEVRTDPESVRRIGIRTSNADVLVTYPPG